jgi:hypothetical protein
MIEAGDDLAVVGIDKAQPRGRLAGLAVKPLIKISQFFGLALNRPARGGRLCSTS